MIAHSLALVDGAEKERLFGVALFNRHKHNGVSYTGRAHFGIPTGSTSDATEKVTSVSGKDAARLAQRLGFSPRVPGDTGTSILIVDYDQSVTADALAERYAHMVVAANDGSRARGASGGFGNPLPCGSRIVRTCVHSSRHTRLRLVPTRPRASTSNEYSSRTWPAGECLATSAWSCFPRVDTLKRLVPPSPCGLRGCDGPK